MDHFAEKEQILLDHFAKEYGYDKEQGKNALEYLKQDESIALEYLYYVENHSFVSEDTATNYHGYTAKRLSEETDLTVLGAFNYMVFLHRRPKDALAYLKKGLPRRTII